MKSNETRRLIIAFAITFLIVVLWQPIMRKFGQVPTASEPAPAANSTGGNNTSPAPAAGAGPPVSTPAAAAVKPAAPPTATPVQGKAAQDIVVENNFYRITFSTQGATIKSWVLKKYVDANEKPLEVVNQAACDQLGFPMALNLPDVGMADKLNKAFYTVEPSPPTSLAASGGSAIRAPAKLQFRFSDGRTEVQKDFTFNDSYQVDARISVFDAASYIPAGVVWPGGFGDYSLGASTLSSHSQAVYDVNGDLTKIKESKLKENVSVQGPIAYAGLEDLYFVDIFLPRAPSDIFRVSRRSWNPVDSKEKQPPAPFQAEIASGASQPLEFGLFIAPKDLDLLHAMKPPLDNLVDFGIFSLLAKPLFLGMRYIYDHWVHNYGWAIVILTVIINFALFPLKLKSIHSAQKMQKAQPIVKRIQDKYKQYKLNDPRKQKMQQEIMEVYKQHGVNPLGGCLPMILQLPFLYAIYEVLGTVIEIRHAPWIGCVRDLSVPDACHPFGIPVALLPTLMIISMFVMQKMTPMATADPSQQRMLYIMPLFMGVIFYRLASGLVLYYMAANLVGIAQQLIINRFIPVSTPAATNPPPSNGPGQPEPKDRKRLPVRKPVGVKN